MKNKKHLIAYIILILIPMLIDCISMIFLPDTIPAHFGFNGQVDRFGSKMELFILPACSLIFGVIMFFSAKYGSKDESSSKNNERVVLIVGECTLTLFAAMNFYFLYIAFKNVTNIYSPKIQIGNIVCFFIGALMLVAGNIMPKTKKNSVVGFRFPWTMESDEIWKKSQHFAGIASIITGAVLIVVSFFLQTVSAVIVIISSELFMTTICLIYAYKLTHSNTNKK